MNKLEILEWKWTITREKANEFIKNKWENIKKMVNIGGLYWMSKVFTWKMIII